MICAFCHHLRTSSRAAAAANPALIAPLSILRILRHYYLVACRMAPARCESRYCTACFLLQDCFCLGNISSGMMASASERRNVPGYLKGTASTASRATAKKDTKPDIDAASLFSRDDDRPSFTLSLKHDSTAADAPPPRAKTPPLNTHYALIGQHNGVEEVLDDSWGAYNRETAEFVPLWLSRQMASKKDLFCAAALGIVLVVYLCCCVVTWLVIE